MACAPADNNEAGATAQATLAQGTTAAAQPGDAPAAVMPAPPARQPLFQDENLPSFFRRPGWSPDGACLPLPGLNCCRGGLLSTIVLSPIVFETSQGHWASRMAVCPRLWAARKQLEAPQCMCM